MYCLFVIGALLWASAASSPTKVQKVDFHPMVEIFAPSPDSDVMRIPHEVSCHHFYLKLSEEDITIQKCPDEELFDYVKHRCVEKEYARCWNRLIKDINHEPIHIRYQKNLGKFDCPHPFGHFPEVTDCTRYYQCLSGKPKSKKCAPFEYFDKIKRKCMAEIKATCADPTDVIEPDYKCPRSWGSFSFSKDCSKYYECVEKRPDLRTCKKHKLFDEKKMKCVPQGKANCGSRHNPYDHHTTPMLSTTEAIQESTSNTRKEVAPKETPYQTVVPNTDFSVVTGDDTETEGPSRLLPSKFESSENDISKESLENSHEDHSKESLEHEDPKKEDSGENEIEKGDKTEKTVVTEEFISEKSSPETTVQTKEIVTESISTTVLNNECYPGDRTCIRDIDGVVFRCPSPHGFFAHPEYPQHFFQCFNNAIYLKKCPKTLVFIESKRACVWEMSEFKKY